MNKPFPANTNKASSSHRRCLSFSPTLHPLPKQTAIHRPAPSQPSKSYPQRPSHNATSYMASNITAAASPFKGVPRQWRGMYPAGGASTNSPSTQKDFLHLFPDTYPPASPYPSQAGTRGGSPSVSARRIESVSNSLRPSNKQGRRRRPLSCIYFLLLNSLSTSSSIFPSFAYGIVSICRKLQSSGLIELSKPRINRVAIRYMIRVGAKP